MDGEQEEPTEAKASFKKPILIGKIGRLPRKVIKTPHEQPEQVKPETQRVEETEVEEQNDVNHEPQKPHENVVLPYREPEWSGMPESSGKAYQFEVLKSGSIIDNIDLMQKPFLVFGRLANCDISMAHPTVSRYHAVLQYRNKSSETDPQGFYLYDLNSTHGTFFNKMRIKPRTYVRIQVGHMIKLGCSSRNYILTGPDEDSEAPSELSVTELKRIRAEELLRREREQGELEERLREAEEARMKKEEENGIDWGLGEDADEESDIAENPYAQTNNEELYLDDPKKALRGFMEREGFDLEYDCTEQGMGQFLCRVPLPVDDDRGKQIVAEVLHKGKKKEAVIQCALEACRILDRHGLLRQATHESKKRKSRNWEENDFYDSDDDTFLDRTGTVEKKRENRIKSKVPQTPETYQSLLEKEKDLHERMTEIEVKLHKSKSDSLLKSMEGEDSLDSYMKTLQKSKLDKETVTKLKAELHKLKIEHTNILKLVNIARPADLPPLVRQNEPDSSKTSTASPNKLPIFGKRLKVKVQKPEHLEETQMEQDSDDEIEKSESIKKIDSLLKSTNSSPPAKHATATKYTDEFNKIINSLPEDLNEALNTIWRFPQVITSSEHKELETKNTIKQLDLMVGKCDAKSLIQLKKHLQHFKPSNEDEFYKKTLRIVKEIVEETAEKINQEEDVEKKRKRNQRRIQQRQEKVEAERLKGYEEDALKSDYNMWVPPEGQSGDGRTSLNDKFGY